MADNSTSTNDAPQSDLIPVTGLWKSTLKSGGAMLSGTVSPGLRLVILPNKNKTGSQPDYRAFFAPATKRAEDAAPSNPQDDI
jgi:hypothetical protein